jgi:predicted MFS family arabinose efflux permease
VPVTSPPAPVTAGENRVLAAGVAATTASVFPAFLTGAVGVQVRADLGISEAVVGLAIAAFFATAAGGSMVLGRAAERLGATTAMRLGLAISIATLLGVAGLARSAVSLVAVLLAGGVANALTQPSANLLLAERVRGERLGLGMALKQAGMPAATMLGGLAVPALALTVGWRWAYVAGAALALVAWALVPPAGAVRETAGGTAVAGDEDPPLPPPRRSGRPDQPVGLLVGLSAAACLGASAAGALAAFLVSGAEAAGLGEGPAGLLLTAGSALGVASRLAHGWLADRRRLDPLARVTVLLAAGTLGYALFATGTPAGYLVGTPIAFAFGWSWPGLFNLAVVRANPSGPAAATGTTQTGVYLGALAGPAGFGLLVGVGGYPLAWTVTAAVSGAAAAVLAVGRRRLRRVAPVRR